MGFRNLRTLNPENQNSFMLSCRPRKWRLLFLSITTFVLCALSVCITSSIAQQTSPKPGVDVIMFDPGAEKIVINFSNGDTRTYKAGNYTTNPDGDPCTIGSHAPAPPGQWFLNPPHFAERDSIRYHRVGAAFFLIGSAGTIPFQRDVGLHAGTSSYKDLTFGCIRISNADMDDLLTYLTSAKGVLKGMSIPGRMRCSLEVQALTKEMAKEVPGDFLENALERQASAAGIDYFRAVTQSEKGNAPELADLFRVTSFVDGAPAELHAENLYSLLKYYGDLAFSTELAKESKTVRDEVIQFLDFFFSTDPSLGPKERNWVSAFPLTYRQGTHKRP
jgi:hypothetical protein